MKNYQKLLCTVGLAGSLMLGGCGYNKEEEPSHSIKKSSTEQYESVNSNKLVSMLEENIANSRFDTSGIHFQGNLFSNDQWNPYVDKVVSAIELSNEINKRSFDCYNGKIKASEDKKKVVAYNSTIAFEKIIAENFDALAQQIKKGDSLSIYRHDAIKNPGILEKYVITFGDGGTKVITDEGSGIYPRDLSIKKYIVSKGNEKLEKSIDYTMKISGKDTKIMELLEQE